MIVDDEEAARYGMRRALTTLGYNITEAGSAEAARALLKQHEPDLLLLDVNLPGMSGLDFLREIKSANGNAPLVIIVTAHGSERMAVEAVKAGQFHVYTVRTIDEGLEILTGAKAGNVHEPGTIHHRAAQRLRELAEGLRDFVAPQSAAATAPIENK